MSHSFAVLFDPDRADPDRAFRASIVLTPLDDFDGAIVAGPVKARIADLGKTATRSLSGHLVFERLKAGQDYRVSVDPVQAGYFAPTDRDIPVPQPRASPDEVLAGDTRILRLFRLPDFVRDGEAMVLRGAVVDAAGEGMNGVVLTAVVGLAPDAADPDPPQLADPAAPLQVFTTRTNAKGNFAIRMRPPRVSLANTPRLPITGDVSLRIGDAEVWAGEIRDLSTRVMADPIQLP